MQGSFLYILIFVFLHLKLATQIPESGLVLSAQDFRNNKISFVNTEGKHYKIHFRDILAGSEIKITSGDSSFSYIKDSIFGYLDKHGIFYRIYQRESYRILNPNETLLIYERVSLGGHKNTQSVSLFYFSEFTDSEPIALTRHNLKMAFLKDPLLYELIDLYFRQESSLLEYDDYYKQYKLNRLWWFYEQIKK